MVRAFFLSSALFAMITLYAFAWDAGVIVNQTVELSVHDESRDVEFTTSVVPWFSAPLGARAELYLSAGIRFTNEASGWNLLGDRLENARLIPEAFRVELAFAPSDTLGLSFGRVPFRDNIGWVMSGLFDGASVTWSNPWGRIDAGLFYTGLLYKGAASINLSPYDASIMNNNDEYFASRRIAGGVGWEQTGVFDTRNTVRLGAVFQFDLNDAPVKVHSQYLLAGASIPLGGGFSIEAGAAFALKQEVLQEAGSGIYPALAASLDFRWLHFGAMPGMLSFGGQFASGNNGGLVAFAPVSGDALGRMLRPEFSGVAIARAAYIVRLHRVLFADLSAAYLFRTDTVTLTEGLDPDSDSLLLGWEFFAGLSWAAFPDLIFTLGGGVLLPGAAFGEDAGLRYRLELTAGISL